MRYIKRFKLMLIAGVLLLAAGVWLDTQWSSYDNVGLIYLANVAPGLVLLFFWFLASTAAEKQWPAKPWRFIVLGVVATSVSLAFGAFVNIGVGAWASATTPTHDPALYEEALKYYPPEMVAHFPPRIPASAADVSFYFLPAFLQGGSYLQLRCKLPPAEIQAAIETHLSLALQVQDSQGRVLLGSKVQAPIRQPYFELDSGSTDHLPEGFRVMILGASIANHGYTYGLAASPQSQEVIYWVEHW